VDFEDASALGNDGEKRVSRELSRLALRYPFKFVDDILLEPRNTAQLDHLVVDSRGILIIETKVRNALIRGTDKQKNWTACYPGHRHVPFQNPLLQNDGHENRLRHALRLQGIDLASDYFANVVVFFEANLSALDLGSAAAERVLTVDRLEQLIHERQATSGPVEPPSELRIEQIMETVLTCDKSANPRAVARHGEHVREVHQGRGEAQGGRGGVVAAAAPARQSLAHCRALDARPLAPRLSRRTKAILFAVARPLAYFALVWWLFLGGGGLWLTKGFVSLMPAVERTLLPGRPDVSGAKRALKDAAPEIYPLVTDLDKPTIGEEQGYPTYTWHYVKKLAANKVKVWAITLAIDQNGQVRHAEQH
jgi:hypothetical protein